MAGFDSAIKVGFAKPRRKQGLGLRCDGRAGAGRIVAFGDSQLLDERHRPPPPPAPTAADKPSQVTPRLAKP